MSLSGKTIVFTGTLSLFKRAEAKQMAESVGAKVTAAVSGNTDIVVAGPGAGSKLDEAKAKGTKIMTEQEFLDAVKGAGAKSAGKKSKAKAESDDDEKPAPKKAKAKAKAKAGGKKAKEESESEEEEEKPAPKKAKAKAKAKAAAAAKEAPESEEEEAKPEPKKGKKAAAKAKAKAKAAAKEESEPEEEEEKKPAPKKGKKAAAKKAAAKEEVKEEEPAAPAPPAAAAKPAAAATAKPAAAAAPRAPRTDRLVPAADSYTVHGEYHTKLNQTNLHDGKNNNKYYIIQLLTKDGKYFVWTRWGRVGEPGQNMMQPCGGDESEGIKAFKKKFREKTANDWDSRHSFVKKADKYQLIETEETEGDGGDASVPLGKLSKPQIEKGQAVLAKIEANIKAGKKTDELSSEFFSLIPTVTGRQRPEPIRTLDMLHEKEELLKFYLRMGFEAMDEEPGLTPIQGVMELPVPSSLKAAASNLCGAHDIQASDTKGEELAKKQAGSPVKHMSAHLYASLMLYTSNAIYAQLNKVLRDENRTGAKKYFNYLRLFFEAFSHLPAQKRTLWRGISVDLYSQYKVGSVITWWGVSSCTSDEQVARNFMRGCGGKCTLLTVNTKTACDISSITFYSNEKESLLAPGTQLKVLSSKVNGNVTEIHLEEVGRCVS